MSRKSSPMLRFYGVMSILLATSLSFMMVISQQIGKLSNAPQFAYIAVCGSKTDIFLADFNTHVIVPMTPDGAGKGNILWSPNGEFLAYTTSIGIRMITPDGEIEAVTQVADYNIQWIDDSHLLFQRRDDEQGISYDPFIIDIETDEVQPS